MTELLERAFAEAAKLPASEQEKLAEWILQEIASDQRWASSFADSAEALDRLANEALKEYRQGLTHDLDPDRL